MKRFLTETLVFFAVAAVIIEALCVLLDPFNVFHPFRIRDNGIEPNKNYIKCTYILKNPGRFDSLLFGSSRVGNIHTENIPGHACYNMTYSVGLPSEHLNNLKTFIDAGVKLDTVYVGVDDIAYKSDPYEHLKEPLRSPYEHLKNNPLDFVKLYLNPAYIGRAFIENAGNMKHGDSFREVFYNYGWNYDYGFAGKNGFYGEDPEKIRSDIYGIVNMEQEPPLRFEEALQDIAGIVDFCESNGIELYVFVNPMLYAQKIDESYLEFIRRLAGITPFYNFGGYNDLVFDAANYIDDSHINAETSDLIIRCMCEGEKIEGLYEHGFGVVVTSENVEDIIPALCGQRLLPYDG